MTTTTKTVEELAVELAEKCGSFELGFDADEKMRRVRITNIYELHGTHVVEREVRDRYPDESDEEYDDYLFEFTGVGFEDGNSAYFMESTDGLEPVINAEWGV